MKRGSRNPILRAFLAKLSGKKQPLFIGWNITHRCNYSCEYCDLTKVSADEELKTDQVLWLIDELAKLGAVRIHFGGGEALLRRDLAVILERCKYYGIKVCVLTNGSTIPTHIKLLKQVDLVKISFDGPQELHDWHRADGSYKKVQDGIALLKKEKIRVVLSTTLTRENVLRLPDTLAIARSWEVPIKIQPASEVIAASKQFPDLSPSQESMEWAMDYLMEEKKKEGKQKIIINSKAALGYLRQFPKTGKTPCYAGKIYMRISPQGYFFPCTIHRDKYYHTSPFTNGGDVRKAFMDLIYNPCKTCWCTSTLDLNLTYSLRNFSTIFNALRMFRT